MLFGPNIGYGGTTFEYDSNKDYYFRVSEPWGKRGDPIESRVMSPIFFFHSIVYSNILGGFL